MCQAWCRMRIFRATALTLLLALTVRAQQIRTAPRKPADRKPACAAGAICFSGGVFRDKQYRHPINSALDFVLEPGWTISVVSKHPEGDCDEFASVVNSPYRAHRLIYIDMSYGWTAEDEVNRSSREFLFGDSADDKAGKIEWMQFAVEIKLPKTAGK